MSQPSGQAARALKERNAEIQKARQEARTAFSSLPAVALRTVTMLIDPDSMYSSSREHHCNFWQITSAEQAADTGIERCLFTRGFSFSREAVPELVNIMQRDEFKDWKDKFEVPSKGNLDASLEWRSWNSSKHITQCVLRHVFKGAGFTSAQRAQVRHLTLWTPEVALGCVALNQEKSPFVPRLAYCGSSCLDGATQIAHNVNNAILNHLLNAVEKGEYGVPGFKREVSGASEVGGGVGGFTSRPKLNEEAFKVTCPRGNGELPVREPQLQKMTSLLQQAPHLLKQLKEKIHKHNETHNPSEVTFKEGKRTAPDGSALGGQQQPMEQAVTLPPADATLESLTASGLHVSHGQRCIDTGVWCGLLHSAPTICELVCNL